MTGSCASANGPRRGEQSDRRLIAALTADLRPVRAAPPLALAAGVVLAIAAASIIAVLATAQGSDPIALRLARPASGGALLGLVVAGVAGTLAALFGAAPDRERASVGAAGVALAGVALAAALCLVAWSVAQAGGGFALSGHVACLRRSTVFALAPALALFFFWRRGWVARPGVAAASGLIGAFSLGALVVHLECEAFAPLHLLLGHLAAPLLASALGLAPLALLLRRLAR